jgi:carotenoid cleavage dioxygenase-like enzyme
MEGHTPFNASRVDGDTPVKFHILDRETGKNLLEIDGNTWTPGYDTVAKETAFRKAGPGWFHTHTVNGYEEADGTIVADYCAYPDMGIFYGDFMLNLVNNPLDYMKTIEPARLVRCKIKLDAKTSECKVMNNKTFELPTFNMERYSGVPYRYAYASSAVAMESDFVDQLIKVDLNSGNVTHEWHDHSDGHWFVNEPVFIANPNGSEEDDGVLTCVVYDAANDVSSWLILNAKDFTEVARIHLGVKMQAHFHGKFCKSYGDKSCVGL